MRERGVGVREESTCTCTCIQITYMYVHVHISIQLSYTAKNNWARFDTDCRKVSNRGQGGARVEHVRPLRPRTDTGVTCRFEL